MRSLRNNIQKEKEQILICSFFCSCYLLFDRSASYACRRVSHDLHFIASVVFIGMMASSYSCRIAVRALILTARLAGEKPDTNPTIVEKISAPTTSHHGMMEEPPMLMPR